MAFTMRTSKPGAGNKYYIRKANGGYSNAISGSPTDGECNVLANCVGYAYGRFNEIGGYGYCKYLAPVNAENFMSYKGSCEVGQTPRAGACMVWQKGATLNGSDGAGHVAIVEKVISETEVYTSESGYGSSKPFWNSTRKKGSGNWGCGTGYKFLGFIYNPAVKEATVVQPPQQTKTSFNVGDEVSFTGTKHYRSANAASAKTCKPGKAKITAKYNGKHPYHLVRVSGGGSTVYGWVDAADIAGAAAAGTTAAPAATIKKGSTVKVKSGAKTYKGGGLASFVYKRNHIVKEISGDRVVITYGGVVVAAVKVSDLTLVRKA